MKFQIYPEVVWLLVNETNQKEELVYLNHRWNVPVIGKRPPYYGNPRYTLNYPLV